MIELTLNHAELGAIADEFGATETQVMLALRRARVRTARGLKTLAGRELKGDLDLRTMKAIRRRLRDRVSEEGVSLWVGLNSLPIMAFKGRPRQTAAGVEVGEKVAEGAFLAMGGAYWRTGPDRFPLQTAIVPISEEAKEVLSGRLWPRMKEMFMDAFRSEIRARTVFGVGAR